MARRKVDTIVHRVGDFTHNRGEYVCGIQFEPKWGTPDEQYTEDPEVWVDDDDGLFTRNAAKTTCPECKRKGG